VNNSLSLMIRYINQHRLIQVYPIGLYHHIIL